MFFVFFVYKTKRVLYIFFVYKTKMVVFIFFNKIFIYLVISIKLLVNFQPLLVAPNLEKMRNLKLEVSALTSEKLSALTLKITVLKS